MTTDAPTSLDLSRPFTRAQARTAGIKDSTLRGPRFRQLFRGVHVSSATPLTLALRCEAAVLLHPDEVWVDGATAAALHGLPVPDRAEIQLRVTELSHRRPRPGLQVRLGKPPARWGKAGRVPVVTGAEVFARAESLSLLDRVILGDAMVCKGVAGVAEISAASGSRAGRRAARLVRADVDSPMETRLRLLLVFAGFPEPAVNRGVGSRYRVDLCWPDLKLGLEYDGTQHRADLDQWEHDIERNEWFDREGWHLVHVISRDVFRRPDQLLERVAAAWRAAGGGALRPSEEWRTHFPV